MTRGNPGTNLESIQAKLQRIERQCGNCAAITSAAKGVFTVALYRYASQGEAPAGFSAALIDSALGGGRPSGWGVDSWPKR